MCPNNRWQFFAWCNKFLPNGDRFYIVGLAAVTWAIRLARNRATFEHKKVKTPFEIVFPTCSFLLQWAGLQKESDTAILRGGTERLHSNMMNLMKIRAAAKSSIDGRQRCCCEVCVSSARPVVHLSSALFVLLFYCETDCWSLVLSPDASLLLVGCSW